MSCVHFCTSPTVPKLPRLESLILVENVTSDSDLEDWERKHSVSFFNLSPVIRRHPMEYYLRNHTLPLKESTASSRSSSMLSLQTLVPACYSTSDLRQPRHRQEVTGPSLSMENLLFA